MAVRKERMADQIRDLLASAFLGGKLNDPRLEGITITAVKLSPDLQLASVYYRVYDDSRKDQALAGLVNATGFLKRNLKTLEIRRIPDLRFFFDESLERAAKIEDLLRQI
jgi:ribosome-binding factor A